MTPTATDQPSPAPPAPAPASPPSPAAAPSPTIARALPRLAAAGYDGMLLLAPLAIVTAIVQVLTHGEGISTRTAGVLGETAYSLLMLAVIVGYFWISWTRSGQTLGMKAWHLRVEQPDGRTLRGRDVLLRLVIAVPLHLLLIGGVLSYMARLVGPLGAALTALPLVASYAVLWRGRGTAHDLLSRTRVVRVAKEPKRK